MSRFKQMLKAWFGFPHLLRRMQYPHLIRSLRVGEIPHRILDLGCGGGQLAALLSERAFVVGADVSLNQPMVRQLSKPGRLCFAAANGLRLPFSAGAFDAVTMSSVLQMEADDAGLLRECHRVLAHGGCLVLTVPVGYVYIPGFFGANWLAGALRKLLELPQEYASFKTTLNARHQVGGRGYYSVADLQELLTRSGYDVIATEYVPRTLGTFLYEASLILRWALGRSVSVSGYPNLLLYPIGWFDRWLPPQSKGCEQLVACSKIETTVGTLT